MKKYQFFLTGVSNGVAHFIKRDGKIYGFGKNDSNQLTKEFPQHAPSPVWVLKNIKGNEVLKLCQGHFHVLVLVKSQKAFAIGGNEFFQCGIPTRSHDKLCIETPTEVPIGPLLDVATGYNHSCFLTNLKHLYTSGSNKAGQLGLGHDKPVNKAMEVVFFRSHNVIQIVGGYSITLVLTSSNKIYKMGVVNTEKKCCVPMEILGIPNNEKVDKITSGLDHFFALTSHGSVYGFGRNSDKQLGECVKEYDVSKELIKIEELSNIGVVDIKAGYLHSLFLLNDSTCLGTGDREVFGCGGGTKKKKKNGYTIIAKNIVQIACGECSTFLFSRSGKCFVGGSNIYGNLGTGDTSNAYWEILQNDNIVNVRMDYEYSIGKVSKESVFKKKLLEKIFEATVAFCDLFVSTS